jgi:flagellar hook-length control protein FliK
MLAMPFTAGLIPKVAAGSNPLEGQLEALQPLLAGVEGPDSVFSGELQALLLSLTPQSLQRLESLVAGGMTLPQAARQLLAESPLLLDGKATAVLPDLASSLQGGEKQAQLPQGLLRGSVAAFRDLAVAVPVLPEQSSALTSASAAPSLALTSAQATNLSLTPQLTHSLLDMGVPQAVGSRTWPGAVAERVLWMAQGEQQFARLTLNPPNLGPLEVRIAINQDQTSVTFLASHVAVREALEAAMPRLRELFDQQSMSLVHAEVADPGARQEDLQRGTAHGASNGGLSDGGTALAEDDDRASASPIVSARGLVDLFA